MTVEAFSSVAASAIEADLRHDPATATFQGDHRFDARLPHPGSAAGAARVAELRSLAATIDGVDAAELEPADEVDLHTLRAPSCRTNSATPASPPTTWAAVAEYLATRHAS
jgi:uncharacterized protein (DUF885 family)